MKATLCLALCFMCVSVTYTADCGVCKNVCVLHDSDCCTKGAVLQFNSVVDGMNGLLPNLDPLCIRKMVGKVELTQIILNNIEFKGLRDCEVTQLKLNVTDTTYRHRIHCPKLTIVLNYVPYDECACQELRKKVTITAYNCDILNTGEYGILVKEEDLQPHFFLKSHFPHLEILGELRFDICDTCCDVCEECCALEQQMTTCDKTKDPLEDSCADRKRTIAYILSLIFKEAMRILFLGMDAYNRKFLMGEVLPGSTCSSD